MRRSCCSRLSQGLSKNIKHALWQNLIGNIYVCTGECQMLCFIDEFPLRIESHSGFDLMIRYIIFGCFRRFAEHLRILLGAVVCWGQPRKWAESNNNNNNKKQQQLRSPYEFSAIQRIV